METTVILTVSVRALRNRAEATMSASDPNPLSFLPLHPLEFRILMVLLEEPAHGYAIVQEIESKEKDLVRINPGNLYRRIRDLRAKGLIAKTDPPGGEQGDSRRLYFQVTGLGREVGQLEAERLRTLVLEARSHGLLTEA